MNAAGSLTLKSNFPMEYSRGVLSNKWLIFIFCSYSICLIKMLIRFYNNNDNKTGMLKEKLSQKIINFGRDQDPIFKRQHTRY